MLCPRVEPHTFNVDPVFADVCKFSTVWKYAEEIFVSMIPMMAYGEHKWDHCFCLTALFVMDFLNWVGKCLSGIYMLLIGAIGFSIEESI